MVDLHQGKVMIGHKLRRLRTTLKLSQTAMATELGISTSYLNLLENNARPVTVPILFRLGQAYDVDLREMAEDDSSRLTALINEVMSDRVFEGLQMSRRDIHLLASQHPTAASALIMLHQAFDQMREAAHQGGASRDETVTPKPLEAVRRFLEESGNYFPEIETAANNFGVELGSQHNVSRLHLMTLHLEQRYGVRTQIMPQKVMGNLFREFDPHRSRLLLSENLQEPQRIFQVAAQIALIGYRDIIDQVINRVQLQDDAATLLRITLSGYFAGAVMMPYTEFLAAAQETRYDLELLCNRFVANFEQVCHRLTTLNKSNERGIPFFFLRVDEAGYISKRLSAGGIEFARNGGACSRWIPHQAFRNPGQIMTQASCLEEGQKLLTITRTHNIPRTQPAHYGAPIYAIALGCDLKFAKEIGYTDQMINLKEPFLTPIGLGCHICERQNCQQRGALPRGQKLRFDISKRYSGLFDSLRS